MNDQKQNQFSLSPLGLRYWVICISNLFSCSISKNKLISLVIIIDSDTIAAAKVASALRVSAGKILTLRYSKTTARPTTSS